MKANPSFEKRVMFHLILQYFNHIFLTCLEASCLYSFSFLPPFDPFQFCRGRTSLSKDGYLLTLLLPEAFFGFVKIFGLRNLLPKLKILSLKKKSKKFNLNVNKRKLKRKISLISKTNFYYDFGTMNIV